jgi:hypothetical protein
LVLQARAAPANPLIIAYNASLGNRPIETYDFAMGGALAGRACPPRPRPTATAGRLLAAARSLLKTTGVMVQPFAEKGAASLSLPDRQSPPSPRPAAQYFVVARRRFSPGMNENGIGPGGMGHEIAQLIEQNDFPICESCTGTWHSPSQASLRSSQPNLHASIGPRRAEELPN